MAKAPGAFRSISEVATTLGVPQHTLRAWEARFPFVKPVKRTDGRRYYRPADVAMLADLNRRLTKDGLSTDDIVRLHRIGGLGSPPFVEADIVGRLRQHLTALKAAGDRLLAVLG